MACVVAKAREDDQLLQNYLIEASLIHSSLISDAQGSLPSKRPYLSLYFHFLEIEEKRKEDKDKNSQQFQYNKIYKGDKRESLKEPEQQQGEQKQDAEELGQDAQEKGREIREKEPDTTVEGNEGTQGREQPKENTEQQNNSTCKEEGNVPATQETESDTSTQEGPEEDATTKKENEKEREVSEEIDANNKKESNEDTSNQQEVEKCVRTHVVVSLAAKEDEMVADILKRVLNKYQRIYKQAATPDEDSEDANKGIFFYSFTLSVRSEQNFFAAASHKKRKKASIRWDATNYLLQIRGQREYILRPDQICISTLEYM